MKPLITRRTFLRNSALGGASLLLLRNSVLNSFGASTTPPNIVMLVLDDQDAYSPFWDAMPVLSSLRDSGVNFTTAFCPTPICTPARCTLLTGRLAHNTGVFTLSGPYGPGNFKGSMSNAFPAKLHGAGYCTGFIGKPWGTGTHDPGWSYWCCWSGDHMYEGTEVNVAEVALNGQTYSYTQTGYTTDFMATKATKFLQAQAGSTAPFFLWLSPTAPHLPLPPAPRDQATATARWANGLAHRPNYNEPDVTDKSYWLRSTAAQRSNSVPYADLEYPKRMGSLMAVDLMLSQLRDTLIAQGQWANTVVIMVSDNGYNLGSHRLIHKMAPYEESIRTVMCISGAGIQPATISRMVGTHDIGPTVLDLAGILPPAPMSGKYMGLSRGQVAIQKRPSPTGAVDDMDGKSLLPFLRTGSNDAVPSWRTSIITEYVSGGVNAGYNPGGTLGDAWQLDIPTYTSIRTETSKYIYFAATGEEEVYDLVNDPGELDNRLYVDPTGSAALLATLRARMAAEDKLAGWNNP